MSFNLALFLRGRMMMLFSLVLLHSLLVLQATTASTVLTNADCDALGALYKCAGGPRCSGGNFSCSCPVLFSGSNAIENVHANQYGCRIPSLGPNDIVQCPCKTGLTLNEFIGMMCGIFVGIPILLCGLVSIARRMRKRRVIVYYGPKENMALRIVLRTTLGNQLRPEIDFAVLNSKTVFNHFNFLALAYCCTPKGQSLRRYIGTLKVVVVVLTDESIREPQMILLMSIARMLDRPLLAIVPSNLPTSTVDQIAEELRGWHDRGATSIPLKIVDDQLTPEEWESHLNPDFRVTSVWCTRALKSCLVESKPLRLDLTDFNERPNGPTVAILIATIERMAGLKIQTVGPYAFRFLDEEATTAAAPSAHVSPESQSLQVHHDEDSLIAQAIRNSLLTSPRNDAPRVSLQANSFTMRNEEEAVRQAIARSLHNASPVVDVVLQDDEEDEEVREAIRRSLHDSKFDPSSYSRDQDESTMDDAGPIQRPSSTIRYPRL